MRGSREEWLRANGFARSEQPDLRAAEPAERGGYRGQFPRYSRLPCPVSGNIMLRRLVLCATTFGTQVQILSPRPINLGPFRGHG
jgi:hypothetical protein